MSGADLSGVDLSHTYLEMADPHGADLSDANLINTDLRLADLRYAELSNADLNGAIMAAGTDLSEATGWTKQQLTAAQFLGRAPATMPNGPEVRRLAQESRGGH